jgi:hypothetical protein
MTRQPLLSIRHVRLGCCHVSTRLWRDGSTSGPIRQTVPSRAGKRGRGAHPAVPQVPSDPGSPGSEPPKRVRPRHMTHARARSCSRVGRSGSLAVVAAAVVGLVGGGTSGWLLPVVLSCVIGMGPAEAERAAPPPRTRRGVWRAKALFFPATSHPPLLDRPVTTVPMRRAAAPRLNPDQ